MQFLPSGPEAEEVLEALLAGDNFHLGCPSLNWQVLFHDCYAVGTNFLLSKFPCYALLLSCVLMPPKIRLPCKLQR